MRLYLIRHAQSGNNALLNEIGRSHDPLLTPTGELQAQKVSAYLAAHPEMPTGAFGEERNPDDIAYRFTHLYCSAMTRAIQTANAIGQAIKMKPRIWRDIHEVGGIYLDEPEGKSKGFPGLTRTELLNLFPDVEVSEDVTETGWWPVEAGRELRDQAVKRAGVVAEILKKRAETNPDDHVALVTHGAFMSNLIQWLMNGKARHAHYYVHYNTAITRIDFNDPMGGPDAMRLHYLNRLDHLSPDERTY